jgi:squalene-hopene/tetraprenyl-beta-curcumene cyclase
MFVTKIALAVFLMSIAATGLLAASGWDRQKAFDYLEARQQQWAEWKPTQKAGGPCISCHTGLSYMVARRVSGEKQARPLESRLVQGVQSRLLSNPPKTMLLDPGVEAVLNLLTLSLQRRRRDDSLAEADRTAMKRLWENQIQEGESKGAWTWFLYDLHPVESEHSVFYGATLAEMALSAYPAAGDRVGALRSYLTRELPKQPLHNKMAWIAFGPKKDKESQGGILRDLWGAQSKDGGWSTAALGPWAAHSDAPADSGSNAYATAWAAFTAREAGVACTDSGLKRAMAWLERNQDKSTGAWRAVSMNKVYPEGSIQSGFMTDAATGWAAAALAGCK